MEAAQKAQSGEGEAEIDELDEEEGDDVDEPSAGGKRKKANGGKEGAKKKVKTEKKKVSFVALTVLGQDERIC